MIRRRIRPAALAALALLLPGGWLDGAQRRKNKPDVTQTLDLPPEPPQQLSVSTDRLTFRISPLSARGLLSQQTRDGLKALLAASGGAQVVRLRAFVAGNGDLRRVSQIVGEVFNDKHQALPVVSVVRVGALPLEGAQVQLEATLQQRRPRRAPALLLAVAQASEPQQALERMNLLMADSGVSGDAVLKLSCAVADLDSAASARSLAVVRFPHAVQIWMQAQRLPEAAESACEAAAEFAGPVAGGVRVSAGAVAISAPRLLLTGTQMAFRYQESDARLAYERLERTLKAGGAGWRDVVYLNIYPLSPQLAELARRVRGQFVDGARVPPGLALPFEGLPSMDASFALEAIAIAVSSSQ